MISAISSATDIQRVSPSTKTSPQSKTQSGSSSTSGADSVQLSATAQAVAAAIQESRETSVQTAKEAGQGDIQAQRLLAREAAAAPAAK
jgi:hypothetical protein